MGYSGDGASSNNKLYCDCVNFKLFSESGHYINRFVSSTGYKQYFVTHVRKSIKVEKNEKKLNSYNILNIDVRNNE